MFERVIEFIAPKNYVDLKQDYPKPIKLNIPEWYKKLNYTTDLKTVKGCMPFLDALTFGYVLSMPQDMSILHNLDNTNEEGEKIKDCFHKFPIDAPRAMFGVNLNDSSEGSHAYHHPNQLGGKEGGCPILDKNKNLPVHKIFNPWIIKTPPGYSCLFTSPLNNNDDRFNIISGIVDTDTFDREINFPIIINGDKYPVLDTILKKGTPYVQIIPFKRDNWKMKISSGSSESFKFKHLLFDFRFLHNYKSDFWKKKKCS